MAKTLVEFHLCQTTDESARIIAACRAVAAWYDQKCKVHIHCQSEQQAYRVDECLWTFADDSFIPHNFIGDGPDAAPPVRLGYAELRPLTKDCCLNLADDIPEWAMQFRRIIEVVAGDEASKAAARDRYKAYRELGCTLSTVNVN